MNCIFCDNKLDSNTFNSLFTVIDPLQVSYCDNCLTKMAHVQKYLYPNVVYKVKTKHILNYDSYIAPKIEPYLGVYVDTVYGIVDNMNSFVIWVQPKLSSIIRVYKANYNGNVSGWFDNCGVAYIRVPIEYIFDIDGFLKAKNTNGKITIMDQPDLPADKFMSILNLMNACSTQGVDWKDLLLKAKSSTMNSKTILGIRKVVDKNILGKKSLTEVKKIITQAIADNKEVNKIRKDNMFKPKKTDDLTVNTTDVVAPSTYYYRGGGGGSGSFSTYISAT